MKELIAVSILLALAGCANRSEFHKSAVPVNAVAAYFTSVAIHEGGHALAADLAGAKHIQVSILPGFHEGGVFHLGYTLARFDRPTTSLEDSFFNASGTLAELATHIAMRGLLRSGCVPEELQPTAQWLSLACSLGVYGECVMGLARIPSKDLGKEDVWVGASILALNLLFDILDIVTDDPKRYIGVLWGESFYRRGDSPPLRIISDGKFFGIGGDF